MLRGRRLERDRDEDAHAPVAGRQDVAALPGVSAANANFAAGTLRVNYDPAGLPPGQIAAAIRVEGFSCNQGVPGGSATCAHENQDAHGAHVPMSKSVPGTAAVGADDHAMHGKAVAGKSPAATHDAHEGMQHGGGLHAAARDMRRRFLVALIFFIPLFLWSPMGLMEPLPHPSA